MAYLVNSTTIRRAHLVALALVCGSALAQGPQAVIKAYGTHSSNGVTYHYQVTNNTGSELMGFDIGWDRPAEVPELSVLPIGWHHGRIGETGAEILLSGNSTSQPAGWIAEIGAIEETRGAWLTWRVDEKTSVQGILPGQTLGGFTVTVPQEDMNYINGHFTITYVGPSVSMVNFTDRIQRADTTPPQVAVKVNPSELRPPNNKLVGISATLAVNDDYDPAPQVKLESITANEALLSSDISGANFGEDDRQFGVKAKRDGGSKTGRIYTITYSATDASGNRATASATVTVPHDQGK